MSGVSLYGGLEKPLCEAVKMKPGLPWRPQNVGDARAMGYLLRGAANKELNQPKRIKYMVLTKAGRSWISEKHSDKQHGNAEFGICHSRLQSCFAPVFSELCCVYSVFE